MVELISAVIETTLLETSEIRVRGRLGVWIWVSLVRMSTGQEPLEQATARSKRLSSNKTSQCSRTL